MSSKVTPAAPSSSLLSMKTQSRARDEEEKAKQRRKKGAVVMMLQFLAENGFSRTLDTMQQDTGISLQKNIPADNMDLMTIMKEYEEYYDIKFGKKPKFFRTSESELSGGHIDTVVDQGEKMLVRRAAQKRSESSERKSTNSTPPTQSGSPATAGPSLTRTSSQRQPVFNNGSFATAGTPTNGSGPGVSPAAGSGRNAASAGANASSDRPPQHPVTPPSLDILGGKSIPIRKGADRGKNEDSNDDDESMPFAGRLALKSLPRFETNELNELAATIHRDILDHDPAVKWDDIADLKGVKQLLKEAVVAPIKYPKLFEGFVRPWKGILLFGPPGTGKTMVAKAMATECRTTFFNVSASTIVSKWRGDSEKLVRMLFDLAVYYAPSTIFIDELDSIMTARSSDGSEHEGSRRMKTELLCQMDGLSKRKNGDVVFVLAASNVPWDLDGAMLRRLEKRICVGLPTHNGRLFMFKKNLPKVVDDFDYDLVAARTDGHSGADIDIICREATMRTIRHLIHRLETDKRLSDEAIERPAVTTEDVLESIRVTRTGGSNLDPAKYDQWEKLHGSTISY